MYKGKPEKALHILHEDDCKRGNLGESAVHPLQQLNGRHDKPYPLSQPYDRLWQSTLCQRADHECHPLLHLLISPLLKRHLTMDRS